jgi:hypothetical protein
MTQKKHPYNAAGRKLKAAVMSSMLGLKGVDRTLKELPEIVDDEWAELAEKLMRRMSDQVAEKIFGPPTSGRIRFSEVRTVIEVHVCVTLALYLSYLGS